MTFDLQRIIESKRAWQRALAQRPVADKLAMLDALRDRSRTIRAAALRFEATSQERQKPQRMKFPLHRSRQPGALSVQDIRKAEDQDLPDSQCTE